MKIIDERILKIRIKRRKERKVYNGFDPDFYGLS